MISDARIRLLALVLLLSVALPLLGQDLTCVFIPPSKPLTNGENSLWLYCMNNSSNEVHHVFESSLRVKLTSDFGTTNTVLLLHPAHETEVTIAPGGFAKREYALDVPPQVRGPITLDISDFNRLASRVETVSNEAPIVKQQALPPAAPRNDQTLPLALSRFFGSRLRPYEPIFFIAGTYPAAEFQLSLKFQLFDFTNHYTSPLTNLYFAYTQTSYWDLISSDPSFFDTSYKPSFFAYHPNVFSTHDDWFQVDLQGGAEHESNGQGGSRERSLYQAYLQPTITFGKPGHLQLSFQPRAWTYFFVGNNNPDIAHYRGYVNMVTALTLKKDPNSWKNFQVMTKFQIGDEGEHPGIWIDLRYKIPHFNPTIQVQYFTGYGQTLRQYNEKSHGLRAGFCLWYWPDYPPVANK